MISAFWMIIILCGIAGLCALLSNRKSEEYFAFSICGIIVILYLFALAGIPELGYQMVRTLSILAFLVMLVIGHRKKAIWQSVFSPGCVLFVAWILIAWWALSYLFG